MLYFDNLQVTQNHARIIEENHYYAYGLKIAAISSKKMPDLAEGHITNKDLYNDKELIDDADLNWYDYGFRSYDPQIGRFTQLDPLSDYYPDLNPYHYAGLDPIDKVDVAGLGIGDVITIGEVFLKSTAKHVAKSAGSLTSTVLRISGSLTVNVTNAIVQTVVTNQVGKNAQPSERLPGDLKHLPAPRGNLPGFPDAVRVDKKKGQRQRLYRNKNIYRAGNK